MRDGKINHPFSFQQIDGISETLPFHSSLPCIKLLLSLSVQVILSRFLVFTLFWIRFSMNSWRRLANEIYEPVLQKSINLRVLQRILSLLQAEIFVVRINCDSHLMMDD